MKGTTSRFMVLCGLCHILVLTPQSVCADIGTVIDISADKPNSSTANLGSAVSNLLTDTFAYNIVAPESTTPLNVFLDGSRCFHGLESAGEDVTLSFTLDKPYTNLAYVSEVVLDLWGRNGCCENRDDNFDVILYNGDYLEVVDFVEAAAIPDVAPYHQRVVFDSLEPGVVFDRFQIIGHDSNPEDSYNNFTLFEIRLAYTTPYTWTGAAGDGDWSNTVNWVAGEIPVDGVEGDGVDSGLTFYYKDIIAFAGNNLPSTNFPGIGGSYSGSIKDTPTMVLKSGGATTFNVVARENGFWINTYTSRTVLEIGDGIGGGSGDVDLTLTGPSTLNLNRHLGSTTQSVRVNPDGSLTFDCNLMFSYNDTRYGTVIINGGDVDVNGVLYNLSSITNNYVKFISTNGTFTAKYGGDFGSIATVRKRLEKDFIAAPDLTNYHLKAKDNGNSTFTVTPGIYCWTGAAGDEDWSNSVNWACGNIPVDNAPGTGNNDGLTLPFNEYIVFDGTNMPTVNVPQIGGELIADNDTPTLIFKRGGAFTISVTGREDSFWTETLISRTIFTIGDGISGGIEDVSVTIANMTGYLSRHPGSVTNNFRINADGTLIIAGDAKFSFDNPSRWTSIEIDGGTVSIQGSVYDLPLSENNYVEFFNTYGTFTAQFGGDFADLDSVKNSLDVDFLDSTGTEDMRLAAIDNGNNTFTVRYELIPPPGTLILIR